MMPLCSFCPGKGEIVLPGGALCYPCAGKVFRAYRRHKQLREANEHGVYGLGSPLIAMRPEARRA